MSTPNVLVLVADQWRGSDQGWIGNRQLHTPNLDRLAAGGVAIAGACATSPVCGPSRASLLTGLLPHEHSVVANDLPLPSHLDTLGTALSGAGYRTGWIGKWHLDGLPRDKWVAPDRRPGFDYWAGVDCSLEFVDGHYFTGNETPVRIDYRGYEPQVLTDLAIDFLKDGSAPFLLTVAYGPPHDPYDSVPGRYRERYAADELQVRANAADTDQQRATQRLYWSAITAVDEQIGRIMATLQDLDLWQDTIVVITSDHGDMLGSHGLFAKQTPYAESIRVPLVLSWPDGLAPARPEGIFGLIDLAPTLLGLAGIPAIGSYGRDLSCELRSGVRLRDDLLLGSWVSFDNGYDQGILEWRGFTTPSLTYARGSDGRPWLLFDDAADPWQLHNLVDVAAADEQVRAADDRLSAILAEVGDTFPPADQLLVDLGLVDVWNARESGLRGDRARLLPTTS